MYICIHTYLCVCIIHVCLYYSFCGGWRTADCEDLSETSRAQGAGTDAARHEGDGGTARPVSPAVGSRCLGPGPRLDFLSLGGEIAVQERTSRDLGPWTILLNVAGNLSAEKIRRALAGALWTVQVAAAPGVRLGRATRRHGGTASAPLL